MGGGADLLRGRRGRDPDVCADGDRGFTLGRAIPHGTGTDLTILATGSMVHPALGAAAALTADGISTGMLDVHTVKPLDAEAVLAAARRSCVLLAVEEHNVLGVLGGGDSEIVAEHGIGPTPAWPRRTGAPVDVPHAPWAGFVHVAFAVAGFLAFIWIVGGVVTYWSRLRWPGGGGGSGRSLNESVSQVWQELRGSWQGSPLSGHLRARTL